MSFSLIYNKFCVRVLFIGLISFLLSLHFLLMLKIFFPLLAVSNFAYCWLLQRAVFTKKIKNKRERENEAVGHKLQPHPLEFEVDLCSNVFLEQIALSYVWIICRDFHSIQFWGCLEQTDFMLLFFQARWVINNNR